MKTGRIAVRDMTHETVSVSVLFFAKSRELVGVKKATVELQQQVSVSAILSKLIEFYPALEKISNSIILAHNQEYKEDHSEVVQLRERDEIAIIPPISGG